MAACHAHAWTYTASIPLYTWNYACGARTENRGLFVHITLRIVPYLALYAFDQCTGSVYVHSPVCGL